MKIAVGCLAIGDKYKEMVSPCLSTHRAYCAKHNYDYIQDESVYDGARPFSWYKIPLIKKYIQHYDYFVWLDADTLVWNDSVQIEQLVACMGGASILCAHDVNNINCGVIIVKNTPYIMDILDTIWNNIAFMNHPWWEQASLINIYQKNIEIRKHIAIIPKEYCFRFNAYRDNLRPTSWILHFPGMRDGLLASAINHYVTLITKSPVPVIYDIPVLHTCELPALS